MKKWIFFSAMAAIIGCSQSSNENASVNAGSANVDSLTATFVAGWNNRDSAAIMTMMADNAVVINDTSVYQGKVVVGNWVGGGVKVLSNFKLTPLAKSGNETIAYSSGTYTLDLQPPGAPLMKEKGNYSSVSEKGADGVWKVAVLHIEDVSKMPDVQ